MKCHREPEGESGVVVYNWRREGASVRRRTRVSHSDPRDGSHQPPVCGFVSDTGKGLLQLLPRRHPSQSHPKVSEESKAAALLAAGVSSLVFSKPGSSWQKAEGESVTADLVTPDKLCLHGKKRQEVVPAVPNSVIGWMMQENRMPQFGEAKFEVPETPPPGQTRDVLQHGRAAVRMPCMKRRVRNLTTKAVERKENMFRINRAGNTCRSQVLTELMTSGGGPRAVRCLTRFNSLL
ncbi:hypothetical protein EYF80_035167 [Liparis tanakae]|uniref:Uncharacterized protein n=1 Tax=Liparis tanakae TaxID=230148 RepID=A0A4Z2GN11_9TELE|nr:hypothetical protein EYF80_035167 [Liparis tanakae]